MFFEIRLMANYLRRTDQVFEGTSQTLRKFDYIIDSRLRGLSVASLAPCARSNPTAFQAVRFEPPRPVDNGENGGIQT